MNRWLLSTMGFLITLLLISAPCKAPIVGNGISQSSEGTDSGFLRVNGNSLTLNGTDFRVVGANHVDLIWSFMNDYGENGTKVIEDAARCGIKALRFSATAVSKDIVEKWYTNNSTFWNRYDKMVETASSNGVYLIPVLVWTYNDTRDNITNPGNGLFEPFHNFSRYLPEFPLSDKYDKSHIFITNSFVNNRSKEFISEMVTKYNENKTILMWEIGNELNLVTGRPDTENYFPTTKDLQNYVQDICSLIWKLDKNHPVESGMQAPNFHDQGTTLEEAASNNFTQFNDFVNVTSIHIYRNQTKDYNVTAKDFITAFLNSSKDNLNKPMIIGEFGETRDENENAPDNSSFIPSVLETTLRFDIPMSLIWEWEVPDQGVPDPIPIGGDRPGWNIDPVKTPHIVEMLKIYSMLANAPSKERYDVAKAGQTLNILVHSNSTITSFNYSEALGQIAFNITGPTGSNGFCRVAIRNPILQDVLHGNCTVLFDGAELHGIKNWAVQDFDDTFTFFNYTHSEHRITIVPEFPSFFGLTPFLMAILLAFTICKRKRIR
jgi:hypothetical protein